MPHVRPLLVPGNAKLSPAVWHWDLPAAATCPGASSLCREHCYARRGRYRFPQVKERLAWCYAMSRRSDFARRMIAEIRRKGAAFVVRIHCAGDFYSAAYVRKWIEVVAASPHTRFYAYTRSWRVQRMLPSLRELASLANLRLWYSADAETTSPAEVPEGVRVAWLQVDERESVPEVDLVFRDYPLRQDRRERIGLTLVCPHETPQGREEQVNCGVCGICWH